MFWHWHDSMMNIVKPKNGGVSIQIWTFKNHLRSKNRQRTRLVWHVQDSSAQGDLISSFRTNPHPFVEAMYAISRSTRVGMTFFQQSKMVWSAVLGRIQWGFGFFGVLTWGTGVFNELSESSVSPSMLMSSHSASGKGSTGTELVAIAAFPARMDAIFSLRDWSLASCPMWVTKVDVFHLSFFLRGLMCSVPNLPVTGSLWHLGRVMAAARWGTHVSSQWFELLYLFDNYQQWQQELTALASASDYGSECKRKS